MEICNVESIGNAMSAFKEEIFGRQRQEKEGGLRGWASVHLTVRNAEAQTLLIRFEPAYSEVPLSVEFYTDIKIKRNKLQETTLTVFNYL